MRRKRWRRRIRFLLSRGWGIGFSFDTIGAWLYDGAMTDVPHTPLLDTVDVPADLRKLKPEQLRQFADELRAEMISAVGTTGGHLGSGLGGVEMHTAHHSVFGPPGAKNGTA